MNENFKQLALKIANLVATNKDTFKDNYDDGALFALNEIEVSFVKKEKLSLYAVTLDILGTQCSIHKDGSISMLSAFAVRDDFGLIDEDDPDGLINFITDKKQLYVIASFLQWRISILEKVEM